MIRSGIMLFLAISTITITMVWGNCEDFTCRHGDIWETIYVNKGDKCQFFTQPDGQKYYPPPSGANCFVKYKMGTCKRIEFNCKSLHLHNNSPKCIHPDKMIIYKHEDKPHYPKGDIVPYPTKKFCQNRAPKKIRSINGLRIRLRIAKHTKGGRGGRDCILKCLD